MSTTNDPVKLGREGGLISGRTRRIQGALQVVENVIDRDLAEMTEQQLASFERGLRYALRAVQEGRP